MDIHVQGEPWFKDGNIIILTDASNVTFKVHRGVLARHSEVFQSMFEIPQPLGGELETLEGLQIIRLYDLPEEMSHILKALYDGVYVVILSYFANIALNGCSQDFLQSQC
jgi:hypothetical protein